MSPTINTGLTYWPDRHQHATFHVLHLQERACACHGGTSQLLHAWASAAVRASLRACGGTPATVMRDVPSVYESRARVTFGPLQPQNPQNQNQTSEPMVSCRRWARWSPASCLAQSATRRSSTYPPPAAWWAWCVVQGFMYRVRQPRSSAMLSPDNWLDSRTLLHVVSSPDPQILNSIWSCSRASSPPVPCSTCPSPSADDAAFTVVSLPLQ